MASAGRTINCPECGRKKTGGYYVATMRDMSKKRFCNDCGPDVQMRENAAWQAMQEVAEATAHFEETGDATLLIECGAYRQCGHCGYYDPASFSDVWGSDEQQALDETPICSDCRAKQSVVVEPVAPAAPVMAVTEIVADAQWHVASASTPNTFYIVKRFSDGVMSCDCDAFFYCRATPKSCKHIGRVCDVYGVDALPTRLEQARATAHNILTGKSDQVTFR